MRLYYAPYHRAVDAVLDRCLATGVPPTLLSIHSFTESWKTTPRPWHVGVVWDSDPQLAKLLLEHFYAEGDLIVGDNKPYGGRIAGDCLWQHATRRGLANALIELRQDLIRDAAGQAAWAERICRIIGTILQDTLQPKQLASRARGGDILLHGGAAQMNGDAAMTKIDTSLVTEF